MGLVDAISNLLNPLQPLFIIDFDVRLGARNTEPALVTCIVDCVIFLVAVQHMVLNVAARVECPANDGAIEAGANEPLRGGRAIASGFPRQTSDRHHHLLILDSVHLITHLS